MTGFISESLVVGITTTPPTSSLVKSQTSKLKPKYVRKGAEAKKSGESIDNPAVGLTSD